MATGLMAGKCSLIMGLVVGLRLLDTLEPEAGE